MRGVLFDIDATLLDHDAAAATRAGLRGVWCNRADDRTAPGTPTIRSLRDLPAVLAHEPCSS